MTTYLTQMWAIIWKDLILEIRSRERIAAMGAFAVLAGVLFNFSIDTTTTRPQDVAAGLIWMTLVFGGLLGVGRTFHLESQDGALQGVLMSPAPKDAVFATSQGGPKVDPDLKGTLLAVTTRSTSESLPMKRAFRSALMESASPSIP